MLDYGINSNKPCSDKSLLTGSTLLHKLNFQLCVTFRQGARVPTLLVNLAFPPQLRHPDLELLPRYYRPAFHHRAALPRRGCGCPLPYVNLYEFAAKSFNPPRRANLFRAPLVRTDAWNLSRATLLAEAPKGREAPSIHGFTGGTRSYHRIHQRNVADSTVAPVARP